MTVVERVYYSSFDELNSELDRIELIFQNGKDSLVNTTLLGTPYRDLFSNSEPGTGGIKEIYKYGNDAGYIKYVRQVKNGKPIVLKSITFVRPPDCDFMPVGYFYGFVKDYIGGSIKKLGWRKCTKMARQATSIVSNDVQNRTKSIKTSS